MIDTYLSRRPSLIGESWRQPGEPIPEAHLWHLTEALVHSGQLQEVQMSEAAFRAAVDKFCPGEANAIYTALGLTSVDHSGMKRGDRPRKAKPVLASEPVEIPAPSADV
jgi:hypothetical protein